MAFDSPGFIMDGSTCSAELFRRSIGTLISPAGGIVTPGDLAVAQQTVPNMSVQIATGQVWCPGTSTATQGPYYSRNGAAITQAINAASASNPRVDIVGMQVQDIAYAGAARQIAPFYVAGTPTAGASVTPGSGGYHAGIGAVPASSIVLAYVLVPTNATSIVTADIENVAGTARAGMPPVAPRAAPASLTASLGDFIVAAPGITVTLPSPSANPNGLVAIEANGSVTGASPVTVAGTNIQGVGLSSASSFLLGTPGASVVLQSDATNWRIVAGRQSTGWVALTLNGASGGSVYARLEGDVVTLKGSMGGTVGTVSATLPTGFQPLATTFVPIYTLNGAGGAQLLLGSPNVIKPAAPTGASTVYFDGVMWSIS